jgi:thymidylate synthase
MGRVFKDPNVVWQEHLRGLMSEGRLAAPRGLAVVEITGGLRTEVSAAYPVVTLVPRRMGYRFMCAEAAWILSGDDRVETIRPYSKNIARYSDDGERFFGAYGPRIVSQWEYAKNILLKDPESRQAVINIWRESPPNTRDYPCTLALVFCIRDERLNLHVTMRSSDAWLGWVYDTFTQSMLVAAMAGELRAAGLMVELGDVVLEMVNSHLYSENWSAAVGCAAIDPDVVDFRYRPLNPEMFTSPTARLDLAGHLWTLARRDTNQNDLLYPWLGELKEHLSTRD